MRERVIVRERKSDSERERVIKKRPERERMIARQRERQIEREKEV